MELFHVAKLLYLIIFIMINLMLNIVNLIVKLKNSLKNLICNRNKQRNYFFNVTLDFLVRGLVPLLFNESLQFIFDDEQVMNAI